MAWTAWPSARRWPAEPRKCPPFTSRATTLSGQELDLYLPPAGTNPPLVVCVHGGGIRQGDKARPRGLAEMLGAGLAVASINYRLSRDAIFPAQLEDCKSAVRWVRARASTHGYDADRIGAWGGSAGGHLVAMLGTTGGVREFDIGEHRDVSSRVQATDGKRFAFVMDPTADGTP